MKTSKLAVAVCLTCALAGAALAMSGGPTASQGAIFSGETYTKTESLYEGGPRMFSVGVYALQQKRGMAPEDTDLATAWKVRHLVAYLGCDVFPWLTLQAGVGESDFTLPGESRDSDVEWTLGAQVRILDYMALDPVVGDDTYWFDIEARAQYVNTSSEGPSGDIEWNELSGALTLGFFSRPERYGFFNRVGIYVGPAVSLIDADHGSRDEEQDQLYGVVGGIVLNPSDNLSFRFEVQNFDHVSFGAALGFHF